jgi:hypothetical protein
MLHRIVWFQRNVLLPSSRSKSMPNKKPTQSRELWPPQLLACRTLQPWGWRQYVPLKCRRISARLHGVTFTSRNSLLPSVTYHRKNPLELTMYQLREVMKYMMIIVIGTEGLCRVGSLGSNLDSETDHPVSFFVSFLSPSRQVPGSTSGHDRFLPHPLQFMIHKPSDTIPRCI